MAHASDNDTLNLSNLLECSICLDLCSGHIRQCKNGHNICASHVLHKCPICRISYQEGSCRNILAENLVAIERNRLVQAELPRVQNPTDRVVASPPPVPPPTLETPTNSSNISQHVKIRHGNVMCPNSGDGCRYQNVPNLVGRHKIGCHFRPISCCLKTDGCNNAQIPFGQYIQHLVGIHKVERYEGSSHWNNYIVKRNSNKRKLVRSGPTSLFILVTDSKTFLIRAIERDDQIYVWVAYHGLPQDGKKYKAKIEFDFPNANGNFESDDNSEDSEHESSDDHDSSEDSSSDDEDESSNDESDDDGVDADFVFSGRVQTTTRMDFDEVEDSGNYMHMSADEVENNLAVETITHKKYVESWAINVTVQRT